uniref:Uncharacterized protein n=1 Tax=Anguilla anguilla TaxID=7936 RepID=A0A0E9TLC6_ANGAN
MNSCFCFLK